jgi:hypothetical protein
MYTRAGSADQVRGVGVGGVRYSPVLQCCSVYMAQWPQDRPELALSAIPAHALQKRLEPVSGALWASDHASWVALSLDTGPYPYKKHGQIARRSGEKSNKSAN